MKDKIIEKIKDKIDTITPDDKNNEEEELIEEQNK